MRLAILKVILWSRNPKDELRIINFIPGKINIITGESATGKSTLTSIIDYCLGSDKCSIPVGLIRNVTAWFGLHIQMANTEMIIARRNPEDQQTTGDLYWAEGMQLKIPRIIEKNARIEDLKNRFNQIAQLPYIDFSTDENVGFGARPSCRDMAAFNFQPQHIVANPYTFFFKADTTEHREKLRIIFPFVLGSIDANTLAKQRELKDTEREYDQLRRELEARLNAAQAWAAEVESHYLQARTLGLLPDSTSDTADWVFDKYVLELQKVSKNVQLMDIPDIKEGTSESAVSDLTFLIQEEDRLGQEIGLIRHRLGKLDQLSSTVYEYGALLVSQEDRMKGVGWFEEKFKKTHECPVCNAVHKEDNLHLVNLQELAREFKSLTSSVSRAPAKLDQELADLRKDLRDLEAALSKVRQKRKFLEGESAELSAQRQRVRQIYLFVGRVEQALENVAVSSNVDNLRLAKENLLQKIKNLKMELDPVTQKAKLTSALDKISARIVYYANLLKLEHAAENIKLNIRELTLQFSPLSGRTDFLWEVGSGQNWVGYHIAGLLALHEHFLNLTNSAVPNFLVIDQPSQVYFPEAWESMENLPNVLRKDDISPDIEGVRRIFSALSHFLDITGGRFQIIVTEHAGEITWKGIPHVHIVGNWRSGGQDDFLIPRAWLNKNAE